MSLITIFPISYTARRQKRQEPRFFDGADQFPLVFRRNTCYAPGDDLPAVIEIFLQQPDVFIIKNRIGGKMIPHQRRPEFPFAAIFFVSISISISISFAWNSQLLPPF